MVSSAWIDSIDLQVASLIKEAKSTFQDTDLPMQYRWEVYLRVEKYLDSERYYVDLFRADGTEYSLYDDLHIDRYKYCSYKDLINQEWEREDCNMSTPFKTDIDFHPNVAALVEQALESGTRGFVNDW